MEKAAIAQAPQTAQLCALAVGVYVLDSAGPEEIESFSSSKVIGEICIVHGVGETAVIAFGNVLFLGDAGTNAHQQLLAVDIIESYGTEEGGDASMPGKVVTAC